jgi:hypothetical protein
VRQFEFSRGRPKNNTIAVDIFKLEATQAVISIFKRDRKGDTSRRKLGRQRIRIGHIDISVPSGPRVALAVGERFLADSLDEDHRSIATHNCDKWILIGMLIGDVKTEPVAIERSCLCDVPHDEGW